MTSTTTRVNAGLICGVLCFLVLAPVTGRAESEKIRGLLENEDCTDFFYGRTIPEGKAGEVVDRYVDVLASGKVSSLFLNINARRTNYRSDVWGEFWEGYDPNAGDDQPFFSAIPKEQVKNWRRLIHNMWQLDHEGVDYPARVIKRCREHSIRPWISLRMNDVHINDNLDHPFHDELWRRPELFRKNHPGYYARALDYAHPEVRDYFWKLIVEVLDRYDIDGLELDFLREPYLFSAGEEQAGGKLLTEWLKEIRQLVNEKAQKRGHPIFVGVRVPAEVETALGLGLDAPTWSREKLVDLVVVAPRWQTVHFDLPIQKWRQQLGDNVSLAGGLESRYQPEGSGAVRHVTPEDAAGAALSVWSAGADAVYLFNYFQGPSGKGLDRYIQLLQNLESPEQLQRLPRVIGVTTRDVQVPGKPDSPPLPATGSQLQFPLQLGPRPPMGWNAEVTIELSAIGTSGGSPSVQINEVSAKPVMMQKTKPNMLKFVAPASAVSGDGSDIITVIGSKEKPLTVRRVEVRLAPNDEDSKVK